MMTAKLLLTALVMVMFIGCSATTPPQGADMSSSRGVVRAQIANLKDMDPLDFLSHLQETPDAACTVTDGTGVWVKEDHLPKLFDLLDSEEKCSPVVHAFLVAPR